MRARTGGQKFMKFSIFESSIRTSVRCLPLLFASWMCTGAVSANTDYYRHIVFDNSLTGDFYFYSAGYSNGGSFLEQQDHRLPVETKNFLTPPNALRIQWQSQPGGGWEAEVRVVNFRNRFPGFSGHNLYFWCFSSGAIAADDLP